MAGKVALILSVGYGEGHNAAGRALVQEFASRGWRIEMVDCCRMAHPRIYEVTRKFYQFCVRTAPWLWSITYAQTATADWAAKATAPILRDVTECIANLVNRMRPDVVLCTYPLFAHMLDYLREEGRVNVPYAVVVTDSLEISRPWMVTKAPMIFLPDEHSLKLVSERYALSPHRLHAAGFPVRREFALRSGRSAPTASTLRLVYGAFAPLHRVKSDLQAIITTYPEACVTVICGERYRELKHFASEKIVVCKRTDNMPELFSQSHFYIGKSGAATMFEAYSSGLPMIVNYALPGQEQGNLALLLLDGAGVTARTTLDLMAKLKVLMANGAEGWTRLSTAMLSANRGRGAAAIADAVESVLLYE